mmetsp:Transcript_40162/g.97660  ORF Transcript_40162/g.97660 Transcript_40162/m.97660 type:complete len:256 (-) Transcript_40162:72-839(-)
MRGETNDIREEMEDVRADMSSLRGDLREVLQTVKGTMDEVLVLGDTIRNSKSDSPVALDRNGVPVATMIPGPPIRGVKPVLTPPREISISTTPRPNGVVQGKSRSPRGLPGRMGRSGNYTPSLISEPEDAAPLHPLPTVHPNPASEYSEYTTESVVSESEFSSTVPSQLTNTKHPAGSPPPFSLRNTNAWLGAHVGSPHKQASSSSYKLPYVPGGGGSPPQRSEAQLARFGLLIPPREDRFAPDEHGEVSLNFPG